MGEIYTRRDMQKATEMLFSEDTAVLLAKDYALQDGKNLDDFNRMKSAILNQQNALELIVLSFGLLSLIELARLGLTIQRFVKKR